MPVKSEVLTIRETRHSGMDGDYLDLFFPDGRWISLDRFSFYLHIVNPEGLLRPGRRVRIWQGLNELYEIDCEVPADDPIRPSLTIPPRLWDGNFFAIWSGVTGPDIAKAFREGRLISRHID